MVLKHFDHPNILKIYDFIEDEKYAYIVTEHCNGGNLLTALRKTIRFSERRTAKTIKAILSAVSYGHKRNILHKYLRPDCISYSDNKCGTINISGYGLTPNFKFDKKTCLCNQNPFYISPEVLDGKFSKKCDLWSVGIIMYLLLCGYPPYTGSDDEEILNNIQCGRLEFPCYEWTEISEEAKDLIRKLLNRIPT